MKELHLGHAARLHLTSSHSVFKLAHKTDRPPRQVAARLFPVPPTKWKKLQHIPFFFFDATAQQIPALTMIMNECDELHRQRLNRLIQTCSTIPSKVTVCYMCDYSNLTEQCSKLKANAPDRSQFLLRGFNRCHGPIAKTSYCGHSTVKPQRWSTWWMSDRNESSHGFTSFEFMHGEACQGREMMWTLLSLFVKISHTHTPPSTPPPCFLFEASHLLSHIVLPMRLRIQIQHLWTYRTECN